jgi:hypothetical protein
MKSENNDISLVVIDAVSHNIEENGDVALKNIQGLIDSGIAKNIYEFLVGESCLRHDGRKIKRRYWEKVKLEDVLPEVSSGKIILVGGSLGNGHYDAFVDLVKQSKETGDGTVIHIPFDCTYSFEERYDSGESWSDGKIGNPKMPIYKKYIEAIKEIYPDAYSIRVDGHHVDNSWVMNRGPRAILEQWSNMDYMIPRLGRNLSNSYMKTG